MPYRLGRFAISAGHSEHATTLLVRASADGLRGVGEAHPSARVTGADEADITQRFDALASYLARLRLDGSTPPPVPEDVPGPLANALDGALLDAWARGHEEPLWHALGLPQGSKVTTGTVSLDTPEAMAREARTFLDAGFRALKIKLGEHADTDRERLAAVRAVAPKIPLRVDGNEGWDLPTVRAMMPALADAGVEMVEQPLPRQAPTHDLQAITALTREHQIAHVLDEAAQTVAEVKTVGAARCVDGVNLKLQKAGGLRAGLAVIRAARTHDLGVMLGCFVETWAGIALATQLVGLVDWVDLDGAWLLGAEPITAEPPILRDGYIQTSAAPGLGIDPAPHIFGSPSVR